MTLSYIYNVPLLLRNLVQNHCFHGRSMVRFVFLLFLLFLILTISIVKPSRSAFKIDRAILVPSKCIEIPLSMFFLLSFMSRIVELLNIFAHGEPNSIREYMNRVIHHHHRRHHTKRQPPSSSPHSQPCSILCFDVISEVACSALQQRRHHHHHHHRSILCYQQHPIR